MFVGLLTSVLSSFVQAVNNGAVYKGQKLNMAWLSTDGKTVPASPTVPSVRPMLSPVDVRTVTASVSSGLDDLEFASPGTKLRHLEVSEFITSLKHMRRKTYPMLFFSDVSTFFSHLQRYLIW
jgi:hypothetical protein